MSTHLMPRMVVSLVTLLALGVARAQWLLDIVDPVTVTSPSGAWSLSVDPSSPRGKGPATYRLAHGDAVVWTADLPCTLRGVQLGDDGVFAGTASAAKDGLRLMLVGPDGKARFDVTMPYEGAVVDGPSYPLSAGAILDSAQDRVVFRVVHDVHQEIIEAWHPVRLSTGEALPQVTPERPHEGPDHASHAMEIADRDGAGKAPPLPPLALEFLGAIELQSGKPLTRDYGGFDIDARGRIGGIIGRGGAAPVFELRDAEGHVVTHVALPISEPVEHSELSAFWLQSDRWLVHAHTPGQEEERVSAWWLDLPSGTLTALPDFDCAPVTKGDGTLDGGFVVLTSQSKKSSMETTLSSFDADGKLRWRDVVWGYPSESGLFSPEDVRVSPRGEIGVLDVIRHEIQRFDLKGKLVDSIKLDEVLGHKLSYPAHLGVDGDGNWVVYDFDGTPPVLRVSREGALTSTFTPHFEDGRVFIPVDGIHVAPDGRLWASDGYALLRLDADGGVDRIVGAAPDATSLGDVECASVDSLGRIELADRRTHAVHVFDGQGVRTAVCSFAAGEVNEQTMVGCIAVSPDGDIHVGLGEIVQVSAYHVFDGDGTPQRLEAVAGKCLFQPGSKLRWVTSYDGVRLLDASRVTIRKITRSPDGRWLQAVGEADVARDGSLAVTSRGGLHIYAPDGEPVMTVKLPKEVPSYAHVALAGSRVFLSFGANLWSVDLASHAVSKTSLGPELSPDVSALCFWRADSSELWVVDEHAKRVLRYREKP